MNISNLNVRITFQKNAVVIDKIGNHTNEWQEYYSCYATVSGETGTEQAIVGETVENVEVCLSVRYCESDLRSRRLLKTTTTLRRRWSSAMTRKELVSLCFLMMTSPSQA